MKFSTCHTAGFTVSTNVISVWNTPAAFKRMVEVDKGTVSIPASCIGYQTHMKLHFYTPEIKGDDVKMSIQVSWCQDKSGNILKKEGYDGKTAGIDIEWVCFRGRVKFKKSQLTEEQLKAIQSYVDSDNIERERVAKLKAEGKNVAPKYKQKWGFLPQDKDEKGKSKYGLALKPDLSELVQEEPKPGNKKPNPYYRIIAFSLKDVIFQGLEAPCVDAGEVEANVALANEMFEEAPTVGGNVQSTSNPIEELEEANPF